jgi:hypothetical protein
MTSERQTPGNDRGRILRFERRTAQRGPTPLSPTKKAGRRPLIEDVDKYAYRGGEAEDERRRLVTNAAASLILIALIASGVWLADTIIAMRDRQDCVISGRTNCAPITRLH